MSLELFKRIQIHDEKGHLIKDTGKERSHSLLISFLTWIEGALEGYATSCQDILNATEVINYHNRYIRDVCQAKGGIGDLTRGIVVGTNAGVTVEDNENYALDTIILHASTTASKLNYQAMVMVVPTVAAGNVDLDMSRPIINDSGGTITVKEIGIYVDTYKAGGEKTFCIARDVISDEAVLDGYTLTVTYTLRTAV